jgi:hypothetical protein
MFRLVDLDCLFGDVQGVIVSLLWVAWYRAMGMGLSHRGYVRWKASKRGI